MKNRFSGLISYLLPSFGNTIWVVVFLGALKLGPRMLNIDGDLGRHLVVGRYILDNRLIPLRDLFSHTLFGQAVTPHEWLAEAIFALSDRLLGLDGVVLVCALLIATAFWVVFIQLRSDHKTLLPALLAVVLTIAASSLHWLSRPHLFTFLMLALWMMVLNELHKGRMQHWWLLPILMLIWANLHGAFIAGFVAWFIYGIGYGWDTFREKIIKNNGSCAHFWRYYLLGGALAFLASLVNPSGLGLWKTSVGYIGNQYLVNNTMEYMSPDFHATATWPFLLTIGLLIITLGLKNKKINSSLLFTTATWLVMGLYSARNIPLFAIISAPLLSQGLEELIYSNSFQLKLVERLQELDLRLMKIDLGLKGIFWQLACLIIVIAGFRAGIFQVQNRFDPQVFPVEAVNWLDDHPQNGEMFNYFTWGGYLLYRQWPNERVFIDGQTDFYGENLTRLYEKVISLSQGWEDVLDQYQVDWAILPAGEPAIAAFRSTLNWEMIYEDDTAVILRKGK